MFRLFRKYGAVYYGYLLLVLGLLYPLYNHDRLMGPHPLDISFGYMLSFSIFWIIFASMWLQEQIEFKTNGYKFLRLLPIQEKNIVRTKFLVVLGSVFIYVVFHCIAFAFISGDPEYFHPSATLMVNVGNLGLVFAACLFIGLIKFGYLNFGKVVFILMFVAIVMPLAVTSLLLPKLGLTRYDVIEGITRAHWAVVTAVGLAVYFGLMEVAAKLKNYENV